MKELKEIKAGLAQVRRDADAIGASLSNIQADLLPFLPRKKLDEVGFIWGIRRRWLGLEPGPWFRRRLRLRMLHGR